jgi:hypothetical protein
MATGAAIRITYVFRRHRFTPGAADEIRACEWKITPAAAPLRDVRSADRSRLPARGRDEPDLLRSRLLRGSLQERSHASRTSCKSIVNETVNPPPLTSAAEKKGHCDENS